MQYIILLIIYAYYIITIIVCLLYWHCKWKYGCAGLGTDKGANSSS